MPRTIFLTINKAVNVRDVLRSGVFRTLKESGHRIVLLSPAAGDPGFVKEFALDNVIVEPLVRHRPGWLDRKLHEWRFTLFPELSESVRMIATPRRPRGAPKRALLAAAMAVKRLLGARRMVRLLMAMNVYLRPDRHHRHLFERYRPDLVVLTEVFSLEPDAWILKRAIRCGVPTMWLVRSWDNLVTKGVVPAPVDRLVVWSETMREEALTLHGYAPEDVYVAGAPHLDVLMDTTRVPGREEFFRGIGADPSKRLITYAMAPLTKADLLFEQAVVEKLWRLAADGKFAVPCQLLVRVYPLRASVVPPALASLPGLLTDVPGCASAVFPDRYMSLDDVRHLAATLRHSSVVVNVASTIVLEAAACGTPAICLGFEIDARPYFQSHLRYFDHTYFKKLLACDGIRLARSMDELVDAINAYLRDPSLDGEGRERIVQRMYWQQDGHAGERVGRRVLDYLDEVTAGRGRDSRSGAPASSRVPGASPPGFSGRGVTRVG